jgi:hypothetical protein
MKIILLVMAPSIVILGLIAIIIIADENQRQENNLDN